MDFPEHVKCIRSPRGEQKRTLCGRVIGFGFVFLDIGHAYMLGDQASLQAAPLAWTKLFEVSRSRGSAMTSDDEDCLYRVACALTKLGVEEPHELVGRLLVNPKPIVLCQVPLVDGLSEPVQRLLRNEAARVLESEGLAHVRNGKTVRLYQTSKSIRIGRSMVPPKRTPADG